MGKLKYFVGCKTNCDLTKMTLNISQPHLITKMNQLFNKDVKALMTFYAPYTPHMGILRNQETNTKI